MEENKIYYSFYNNTFYFGDNGVSSKGYSYDEVPHHAIEIFSNEFDVEFDEYEGRRYEINTNLLARVIRDKLLPFTVTIQSYCLRCNIDDSDNIE